MHSCISRINVGDEVDISILMSVYGRVIERAPVVGFFGLSSYRGRGKNITVPVLSLPHNTKLPAYHPSDHILFYGEFPGHYCLPLHKDYITENAITKIFKKKYSLLIDCMGHVA